MSPTIKHNVLLALFFSNRVHATFPRVDFDRMGSVGLTGAFAGLDFFQNSSTAPTFDSTTTTLLNRNADGSLSKVASTNKDGTILAACALGDIVYLGGSFTSLGTVTASNVASYSPSSNAISALGSNGPNGKVNAIYCDSKNSKVWVGGSFTSPGTAVAVWDLKSSSWSKPPFNGFAGVNPQVFSITANSSQSSLFFSGSFLTVFQGNSNAINNTNNPNVPFSTGATPFSSSLVPIPLQNAQIDASPSSSDSQFSSIQNVLCPSGPDGPGQTWLAADNTEALINVRTFTSLSVNGIRLGNTFQDNHGTTSFTVTTIPDNTVRTLRYVDPSSKQNQTCSSDCPLSTDSSVLYQDFLFDGPTAITGVQVKLSGIKGASNGLHILQILSSGAFASAVGSQNVQSCFSPMPSNSTQTGTWTEHAANTNIAGTQQAVLSSSVDVGTSPANAPSFTWIPFVSATGQYTMSILVPGCNQFQDCNARTSVEVTVFPGKGAQPWVTTVSQQNQDDARTVIYNGPISASSADSVTTVIMTLAEQPAGSGDSGKYELVADRVELVLNSIDSSNASSGNTQNSGPTAQGRNAFGFFEFPLNSDSVDATQTLPNKTLTASDEAGIEFFNGIGGVSSTQQTSNVVSAVAHHPSAGVFLGGSFSLSTSVAGSSRNIVVFKNGALASLSNSGLNGAVSSLYFVGDKLFVGGSFRDTATGSTQNRLRGIAFYDVQQNSWQPLQNGVNGVVTSIGFSNGQIEITGNFTKLVSVPGGEDGTVAGGFAVWDVNAGAWTSPGGFLVGSMTFVGNSTSKSKQQVLSGKVSSSLAFGSSGFVLLKNGNADTPVVNTLKSQLGGDVTAAQANIASIQRRSHNHGRRTAAVFNLLPHASTTLGIFKRQASASSGLTALPADPSAPAPAVLAGTFWSNSSKEVAIIGGNFSYPSNGAMAQGVAFYNPDTGVVSALKGNQINGVIRALLVISNKLFVGGQFTIQGTNANGLAIYDLSSQQWTLNGLQPLQGSGSSPVVVRSITSPLSHKNTVIVAGSFAQAGSLRCQAICSYDASSGQWNTLGLGIQGDVSAVAYGGNSGNELIASGSLALPNSPSTNVAQFDFIDSSWRAIGPGSDIPGPVTALAVNHGNLSSIFIAGRSNDGSAPFLSFWNGHSWSQLGSSLQGNTEVSQLILVPVQDSHTSNGVLEPDRMLLVSGALTGSFGLASSALFDGQSFIPYFTSASSTGTPGFISSIFHSISNFSFVRRHFLATGVVILISIAIGAGIVFLLALLGILWTLFSRTDERKIEPVGDDDDDSAHHRPSSLLEHINAATRTTILGAAMGSPSSEHSGEKEDRVLGVVSPIAESDPFAADGSNFLRAETPSDAVAGVMTSEEKGRPVHARYSFDGSGEGELRLTAGLEVEVLDDRDPSWWYARDPKSGREGVVPAAYLY